MKKGTVPFFLLPSSVVAAVALGFGAGGFFHGGLGGLFL